MLVVGSDHGGYKLKEEVKKYLDGINAEYTDIGCFDENSVDYPDIAKKACDKIKNGSCDKGILICGTGIGISIAANKIDGIRAALCHSEYDAKMTRLHNNSNVLCMGGRTTGIEIALAMVECFLNSEFEGGRHQNRVDKLMALEK